MFERFFRWLCGVQSLPEAEVGTRHGLKRSLEATVIRACRKCNAPGVDDNNKYVGETCPICGSDRPPVESQGVIWSQ